MCVCTNYLNDIRMGWLLLNELILEFYLTEKKNRLIHQKALNIVFLFVIYLPLHELITDSKYQNMSLVYHSSPLPTGCI